MYIIQYSEKDQLLEEILVRLKDLSLAYKQEHCSELPATLLRQDDELWTERSAILDHLDQTAGELQRWHYCDC